jgi:prepilin-type N-terminal cleavage/methylation domain-containing protein
MRHNQQGFTLLEIAIVMLVIGLLITMTIRGQELINSSRVKSLAYDFKHIQVALYGYQDKFRALPGDDQYASAHLSGFGTAINNGNGNAIVGGNWNSTSGESFNLWQHVRLAGLMQGSTDTNSDTYVPLNTVGGIIGISEASAAPIAGLQGEYIICSDNIAGKLAKQLDLMLDDGNTATGSMKASNVTLGGAAIDTNSIMESTAYLTCMVV